MPIRKFRSIAEAGVPELIQPGTKEFSRALSNVFRLAARLAPTAKPPCGVYKFRSIEEAQTQKTAWLKDSLRH